MAIKINFDLTAKKLLPQIDRLFAGSARKILALKQTWDPAQGAPVFTVQGRYTARGWTEWTQGFQFGSALLQFDATGDPAFLEWGRSQTIKWMGRHLSHVGVHDHGFNNLSTYGNLLRLAQEGKIPADPHEQAFYELALKVSGAVQAARWTRIATGQGYIFSFNGPQSLFIDTLRSLRSLAVAHHLGHLLMGERDQPISLLARLFEHLATTAAYNVYYGAGRDAYDVRGRTAHECIFNPIDGHYRCPNSQQGFSPFSTWTRGLAWAICGFAEELEFMDRLPETELAQFDATQLRWPSGKNETAAEPSGGLPNAAPNIPPAPIMSLTLRAAMATADFYLENACADGVPMWDTGAPNLHRLGNYLDRPADPFNDWEPVDSSAAAIAAQGLIRLGNYLKAKGREAAGARYYQAGLTTANTLFDEPYLATNPSHQGLLLHSVYHRPNGWDYIAPGRKIPNGESSMWGDYHGRELALLLRRDAQAENYLTFFGSRTQ